MTDERLAELRAIAGADRSLLEDAESSNLDELAECLAEIERLKAELAAEKADREDEAIAHAEHEECGE